MISLVFASDGRGYGFGRWNGVVSLKSDFDVSDLPCVAKLQL